MPEALPGLGLLSEICIIHVHNVFVAGSLFHGDGVSQLVLDVHSIFHPANSLHFFRIKAALPFTSTLYSNRRGHESFACSALIHSSSGGNWMLSVTTWRIPVPIV